MKYKKKKERETHCKVITSHLFKKRKEKKDKSEIEGCRHVTALIVCQTQSKRSRMYEE